jgi:putative endonuclease
MYYVYILASKHHTLYIGVTGSFTRRLWQHKNKYFGGFTAKYNVDQLVYFEPFTSVRNAIAREKELKGWRRVRKIALLELENPLWSDLCADWENWHFRPPE